jgi:hypothetical protein
MPFSVYRCLDFGMLLLLSDPLQLSKVLHWCLPVVDPQERKPKVTTSAPYMQDSLGGNAKACLIATISPGWKDCWPADGLEQCSLLPWLSWQLICPMQSAGPFLCFLSSPNAPCIVPETANGSS